MFSLILATSSRLLMPLMLLFSIFLLLRGHHAPGGGFVGGLVAASAFALYALAHGLQLARRALFFPPQRYIGIGLAIALLSALPSILVGRPFMTSLWFQHELPVIGKVGTPLFFDLGVYILVLGVVLTIILTLMEEG